MNRGWHRACPVAVRTMRRTTALLVVTLLAGTPGLSLACELWCNTPSADAHRGAIGCHKTPDPGAPGRQLLAAVPDCHDAPAVTVFLNEARQPDTRSVTMIASGHETPAAIVRRAPIGDGGSTFNGRSPRRPAFRAILRI